MTQLVTFGETSLRLTPRGRERFETARDLGMRADGTESNAAVAARRLGTEALWLSKLPDTALGHRVVAELHEQGLETDVVWADPDGDGRQGLLFHEPGATPREAVLIEDRAGAAAATLEPGALPMQTIQAADAVFVGGATPALSGQALRTTEAVLRAAGGTTVFELDFRPGLWSAAEARGALTDAFDSIDVLVGSEDDARAVFDRTGKPRELVHSIAAEYDFERVVITRSERGAIAWHDNVIHEQATVDTEEVDPTGQHGAFVGAFLDRLLDGASTDRALTWGVAMAALARTIPGPLTTVDRAAVERVVERLDDQGGR